MKIIIIAAMDLNNVIGDNNNKMLWYLPNDLKRFKFLTLNNIVIMGRKTFESINNKPLSNRKNIVITNNSNYYFPGIKTSNSLENTIKDCKNKNYIKKIFIIGGGHIYKQAMDYADILYITLIYHKFNGTIKFPNICNLKWKKQSEFFYKKNKYHLYNYSFINYKKI